VIAFCPRTPIGTMLAVGTLLVFASPLTLHLASRLIPPTTVGTAGLHLPAQGAQRPTDPCYVRPGPAVATKLACQGGPGSLRVTAAVDAETVDYVSVELSLAASHLRPNIHMTLAARAGQLDGWVSGLASGVDYRFGVRTHRFGCAEDAGNGTWSEVEMLEGTCHTLDLGAEVESTVEPRGQGAATRWLEVFRMAEAGRTIPDFLDNHDSGDMGGDAAISSLILGEASGGLFGGGIITRYCIEIQNVTIAGTTTTSFAGTPRDSAFADYRSTNPPWMLEQEPFYSPKWFEAAEWTSGTEYASWCDLLPDRYWGHLSRASILAAHCEPNMTSLDAWLCDCSEQSTTASRRYTGMTSIGLPVYSFPSVPGVYPGSLPTPVGHWYSHPVGGRCPLGARVGEGGCTWQRAPLSHSIFASELMALGWNASQAWFNRSRPPVPDMHQPAEQTRHNLGVFRKMWQAKALPPCGLGRDDDA